MSSPSRRNPSGRPVATPAAAVAGRPRLEWLDFYRGLAVVVMIEAHVTNTFLHAAAWAEPWRVNLNYINGLVAPAFLFIAGYGLGLGSQRRRTKPVAIRPRLMRLAGIAALGYAMHFPLGQLLRGEWAEAGRVGTQMDVLVCLALSLVALVIIERGCGRVVNAGVSIATVAVLFAAPFLVSWNGGPMPLVAALNHTTGSLFPLLPWAAFVFCGFGEGCFTGTWKRTALLVAGCLTVVWVIGRGDLSAVSSAFFFERLAWVLLLVPICAWLSARWSPRLVTFAGQESLVVYLSHLAILEVLAGFISRNQLGLAATAALYPAVLAASYAVAYGWRKLTVWRGDRGRREGRHPESSATTA